MKTQAITHIAQHGFTVDTPGRGTVEINAQVIELVEQSGLRMGLVQVFTHHTSCSLLITENADPAVRLDLERYFARLVPDGDPLFEHDEEGPDDMSAHIRSVLTAASLCIPIVNGRLGLGTWQGIYLWEHRSKPHRRDVTVTLIGCA
jgi:secondary thiamine-phosphate synthase enzyme